MLSIKGISNIYLKVTAEKLLLDILKTFQSIFFTRSVLGELQLAQITLSFKYSYCNLKIRGLGAKLCVAFLLF